MFTVKVTKEEQAKEDERYGKTITVLEQTVENINLTAIICAVNGIKEGQR